MHDPNLRQGEADVVEGLEKVLAAFRPVTHRRGRRATSEQVFDALVLHVEQNRVDENARRLHVLAQASGQCVELGSIPPVRTNFPIVRSQYRPSRKRGTCQLMPSVMRTMTFLPPMLCRSASDFAVV